MTTTVVVFNKGPGAVSLTVVTDQGTGTNRPIPIAPGGHMDVMLHKHQRIEVSEAT